MQKPASIIRKGSADSPAAQNNKHIFRIALQSAIKLQSKAMYIQIFNF